VVLALFISKMEIFTESLSFRRDVENVENVEYSLSVSYFILAEARQQNSQKKRERKLNRNGRN
jgi:hypothetical protein